MQPSKSSARATVAVIRPDSAGDRPPTMATGAIHPPKQAGSIPRKSSAMPCLNQDGDRSNSTEDKQYHNSVSASKTFEACRCNRCIIASRSVLVYSFDLTDVDRSKATDILTHSFRRFGYVVAVHFRPWREETWNRWGAWVLFQTLAAPVRAVEAFGQAGTVVVPRLGALRITHAEFSKHHGQESWMQTSVDAVAEPTSGPADPVSQTVVRLRPTNNNRRLFSAWVEAAGDRASPSTDTEETQTSSSVVSASTEGVSPASDAACEARGRDDDDGEYVVALRTPNMPRQGPSSAWVGRRRALSEGSPRSDLEPDSEDATASRRPVTAHLRLSSWVTDPPKLVAVSPVVDTVAPSPQMQRHTGDSSEESHSDEHETAHGHPGGDGGEGDSCGGPKHQRGDMSAAEDTTPAQSPKGPALRPDQCGNAHNPAFDDVLTLPDSPKGRTVKPAVIVSGTIKIAGPFRARARGLNPEAATFRPSGGFCMSLSASQHSLAMRDTMDGPRIPREEHPRQQMPRWNTGGNPASFDQRMNYIPSQLQQRIPILTPPTVPAQQPGHPWAYAADYSTAPPAPQTTLPFQPFGNPNTRQAVNTGYSSQDIRSQDVPAPRNGTQPGGRTTRRPTYGPGSGKWFSTQYQMWY